MYTDTTCTGLDAALHKLLCFIVGPDIGPHGS